MVIENDKVYFVPGDIVIVRHKELENRPAMYVVEKVSKTFINKESSERESIFTGLRCRWFSKDGELQEAVFSTKDLIHI